MIECAKANLNTIETVIHRVMMKVGRKDRSLD